MNNENQIKAYENIFKVIKFIYSFIIIMNYLYDNIIGEKKSC